MHFLEAVQPSVFEGADFQAHAAHALILGARGREDASAKARSAINGIPDDVDGVMWAGISFGELRERLTAIA